MLKSRSDRGAASVEYALLAIFIAVAAVVGIMLFGGMVQHLFQLGHDAIPDK
jgi:Flp pilus assembly pilin Flp